jgi:tetratricopeptide (TPR) repeat protein
MNSVLSQTYRNFRIEIAVDPADEDHKGIPDDSYSALKPFLPLKRINVVQNSSRLGWDHNIRSLLKRVKTPFYVILPHDDIWHPHYLETFMALMSENPEVGVVYGDLHTWGKKLKHSWRHAVELPPTNNIREQIFFFLLQGAEAMPWRGITRSKLLEKTQGFPVDDHLGFAVECEYALSLILSGPVLHVPRTLYYKQIHLSDHKSASQMRRTKLSSKELETAWFNHRISMKSLLKNGLKGIPKYSESEVFSDLLLNTALTIAMLRRFPLLPLKNSHYKQEVELAKTLVDTLPKDNKFTKMLKAKLHYFLWLNSVASKDRIQSNFHIKKAIDYNSQDADVCFAMASELEYSGSFIEALSWLEEANKLFPNRIGIMGLREKIYQELDWS